jgi:hypothetical protein
LSLRAGKQVPAPAAERTPPTPPIEAAPGSYVRVRIV